jgi:hypothetical protein
VVVGIAASALETGAAILLVARTNRIETQDIRNTYGLSGALRQVARNTIYPLEDPDTKEMASAITALLVWNSNRQ